LGRAISFVKGRPHDFKIIVTRFGLQQFLYQLTFPYQSIYTVALGANSVQLGLVNSVGMGVSAITSPVAGWLVDKYGVKGVYLFGLAVLALSPLVYALADVWGIVIIGMALYWLGMRVSGTGCSVVCAASLSNEDRATSMNMCNMFSSIMFIVSPMIGALLVTLFGGVNVEGIRPLFYVSFGGGVLLLGFGAWQLSRTHGGGSSTPSFTSGLSEVFERGKNLRRWVMISALMWLPWSMVLPFTQVFAHEVKGAEQYVLGGMVTGTGVASLAMGIPVGRLADKIGRKKVLFLLAPVFYCLSISLILATNSFFLILAGVLQGFYAVSMVVSGAMGAELVPRQQMGRWMGILGLSRGLMGVPAPLLGGLIWRTLGPEWVFLVAIGVDLCFRLPLLLGMPETLKGRFNSGLPTDQIPAEDDKR
jgi:MFS family permease